MRPPPNSISESGSFAASPHLDFDLVFRQQHLTGYEIPLQLHSVENQLLHAFLHSSWIPDLHRQLLSAKNASHFEFASTRRDAGIDSETAILRLNAEDVLCGGEKRPRGRAAEPGNARCSEPRAVFAVGELAVDVRLDLAGPPRASYRLRADRPGNTGRPDRRGRAASPPSPPIPGYG